MTHKATMAELRATLEELDDALWGLDDDRGRISYEQNAQKRKYLNCKGGCRGSCKTHKDILMEPKPREKSVKRSRTKEQDAEESAKKVSKHGIDSDRRRTARDTRGGSVERLTPGKLTSEQSVRGSLTSAITLQNTSAKSK